MVRRGWKAYRYHTKKTYGPVLPVSALYAGKTGLSPYQKGSQILRQIGYRSAKGRKMYDKSARLYKNRLSPEQLRRQKEWIQGLKAEQAAKEAAYGPVKRYKGFKPINTLSNKRV